jgi:uncharacterized protein (TIGR03435 family)
MKIQLGYWRARRIGTAMAACLLAIATSVAPGFAQVQAAAVTNATSPANEAAIEACLFDVASIHPIKDTDPRSMSIRVSFDDKGNFLATGITMKMLLSIAYGIDQARVGSGPDWLTGEQFDITAKVDEEEAARFGKLDKDTMKLARRHALQALLAERFGLKTHWEARPQQAMVLEVAKGGPKLTESPVIPDERNADPNQRPQSGTSSTDRSLTVMRLGMDGLADALGQILHQYVQNATGLKGIYDFKLEWTPDEVRTAAGSTYAGKADAGTQDDASGVSIYTALEEQLGLKLTSRKIPVQVLVIDSIEKPSEN